MPLQQNPQKLMFIMNIDETTEYQQFLTNSSHLPVIWIVICFFLQFPTVRIDCRVKIHSR